MFQTVALQGMKVLRYDQGKKDIMCLTDGFRTIQYAQSHRQHDSKRNTNV